MKINILIFYDYLQSDLYMIAIIKELDILQGLVEKPYPMSTAQVCVCVYVYVEIQQLSQTETFHSEECILKIRK